MSDKNNATQTTEIIVPAPKKIEIELKRKAGKLIFSFSLPAEIEQMYRNQSPEVRTSEKWECLSFYFLPDITTDDDYKNKLADHALFDDFGKPLYENGKFNIAWLRVVGGKGEIEIGSMIGFSELSYKIKQMVQFIREYFSDYYRDFTIKGIIQTEV